MEEAKEEYDMKIFDPSKRKHWPILMAYKEKQLSRKQSEAQLRDLGCETWEVELYLDNDQEGPDGGHP